MKTRFCPSPTGQIHLGNARTALFSALSAVNSHSKFVLRIEDTDLARSKQEYVDLLLQDLQWMGLNWQEGPGVNGENGPYYQSLRQEIYDQYYQQLINDGLAYPCFCSEKKLAMTRKAQRAAGQAPRYPGTCRHLQKDEIDKKIELGEKPTLRFRMPNNTTISFTDQVKGLQQFNSNDIGDFIIRRADGSASFMFCNALDDALMGVELVMRGEDHLTNSPRQIAILQALNLPIPNYAHIALIAGPDGSPLSKRHGSQSIMQLRDSGYLAIAINNYLARVGHSYESNELMSFKELAAAFDIQRLSKSVAHFDLSQLRFWQKAAVHTLNEAEFWNWTGYEIAASVDNEIKSLFYSTIHENVTFPSEVSTWIKCLLSDEIIYQSEAIKILKMAGADFFTVVKDSLDKNGTDFSVIINDLKQNFDIKGKQLFMPLRVAFTGLMQGPEMKPILKILGAQRAVNRCLTVNQLIKGSSC